MDRWVEAADWIVWQLCGSYVRNACTAGYKGIRPGRRLPVAGVPGRADARLRRLRHRQARAPHRPARRPRRHAHRRGRRRGPVCPRASRWPSATSTPTSPRPPRRPSSRARWSRSWAPPPATSMNADVLREVPGMCGVVDGGIVAGPAGATRPGRAASATSSAGSPRHGVPAVVRRGAAAAGRVVHEHLTRLAAAQEVGEHGLVALDWHCGNRSVLVDHELSGLIVGQTLATRPEDVYRALLEATAFGTRVIVETFATAACRSRSSSSRAAWPRTRCSCRSTPTSPGCRCRSSTPSRARRSARRSTPPSPPGAYPDVRTAAQRHGQGAPPASTCPTRRAPAAYDALFAEYRALHDHFGRGDHRRHAPAASAHPPPRRPLRRTRPARHLATTRTPLMETRRPPTPSPTEIWFLTGSQGLYGEETLRPGRRRSRGRSPSRLGAAGGICRSGSCGSRCSPTPTSIRRLCLDANAPTPVRRRDRVDAHVLAGQDVDRRARRAAQAAAAPAHPGQHVAAVVEHRHGLHEPQPGRPRRPRVRPHPDPPRRRPQDRRRPRRPTRVVATRRRLGARRRWAATSCARCGSPASATTCATSPSPRATRSRPSCASASRSTPTASTTWSPSSTRSPTPTSTSSSRSTPTCTTSRPSCGPGGDRHDSLRYAARIELGLRHLPPTGGFGAFTTNFEDLGGLRQLPGLAVQRLMADGYGFGGEGDWKTSALLRALKVMAAGPARRHLLHGGLHLPPGPGHGADPRRAHAGGLPDHRRRHAPLRDPPARHRRPRGPGPPGLHRRPRPGRRRRARPTSATGSG